MPARGGSKSITRKNVRPFRGLPLAVWNLEALVNSAMCDEVYLNTEDGTVYEAVREYEPDVRLFVRQERNARDEATTMSVVHEFIERLPMEDEDILVLTQATSPYLSVYDVFDGVDEVGSGKADSVMSVGHIKRFLWDYAGCINAPEVHKRRQDWEGSMIQNGCMYVTSAGMIRRTGMLWGGRLHFHEQPYWFEIDEWPDFVYGEAAMRGEHGHSS